CPVVGQPEIALEKVGDVVAVLDEQGFVQAELFVHGVDERIRADPVAATSRERVPGKLPDQHVDEEGGAEEHRDGLEQSPEEIAPHGCPLTCGGALVGGSAASYHLLQREARVGGDPEGRDLRAVYPLRVCGAAATREDVDG